VITLADLPGRPCPLAASLEVVGERWSLLVVRELSLGSHRFTDIVAGTGAPRDRVTARLKALTDAGVVQRRQYQSHPDRFEYHLTDAGRALLPALEALLTWGRTWAVAADDPALDLHRTLPRSLPRNTHRRPRSSPTQEAR
jgi:DNA-binding HxlR family transcriptional regulator